VTFNCSAWDDYNLTNITLYGNWSSGWHANETNTSVANNTYTIFTKNITPDGYYKWNCQACDNSGNCNFSAANYTFKVDTTPPTPNPAQISTALATNATQIVVVAGPAIDTLSPPVEYQYNETTGGSGSTNSSWQSGISYSDDDLSTNTSYCYIVQYRDALNNIGEPSSESCVFTLAETPSISSVLCAYSGGYQCTVAFDMKTNPAGTLRYINETTGLGNDSTWSTSTANYVDTGLAAHTEYCYTIKAKNGDDLETVYSDEVCDTMDNRLPGAASNLLPTSTHNLTQNMTWTEGTDPDGDPVSSFFCVATSDTKRNNTDCDVHASNESDPWYQFTGGELSFNAGGANRTFYTRIISNDNYSGNSSNYDTSFLLYNNEPSQSSVAIAPTGPNVTSTLNCTYTFSDPNSDTENTTGTQFQWYVQNEGSGNFVLNASATSQTFSGGFDKDDKVICSVKVEDQYGLEALSFTNSSSVTILNSVPPKVNLSYPVNGDTLFTNRTPKFNWTAVTDPDPEDSVTYHFQLSLNNDCSDPIKNVTSIADNYYLQTTELDFATYYWRVRANDSVSTYGNWSDIWNFTLVPSVDIFMLNNVTDFGGMAPGDSNDTADNSPLPFKLRNDGNTEANVSVNATDLWSAAALGTHYYQFKANQSDELNSFNWTLSQTTWANMSDSRALAIAIFNHTNSNDTAAIDIRVEAKTNEPPGTKSSTIEIYYEEA
jgi:titin